MDPIQQLGTFLSPYPVAVRALALEARQHYLDLFDRPSEIFWDATQAVCIGFTYTHSSTDNFFNLAVYAKHVTLIFPFGAFLEDSGKLLQGNGSRVRHIRLEGANQLHDRAIHYLVKQAEAAAKRSTQPLEPIQIVKVMKGPKRRPVPPQE